MLRSSSRAVLFFALFGSSFVYGEAVLDRYVGVLALRDRNVDQLAKMDFISYRDAENKLNVKAILTLYFGGFDSDEYTSFRYDDVELNLLRRTLTFSQSNQDLTLMTGVFDGRSFEARVRSSRGQRIGTLQMRRGRNVSGVRRRFSSLGGQYRGYCRGRRSYLNLRTYRSSADTARVGNPFGAYRIAGQFGATVPRLCQSSKPCVTNQIVGGSYNFYTGDLTLKGSQSTEKCTVEPGGSISCRGCRYQRVSPAPRSTTVWGRDDPFPTAGLSPSGWASIEPGEYFGYLYHERRKALQRMSFDVVSFQDDDEGRYLLSSLARLHFGAFDSHESLVYRFEDQGINLLSSSIVLQRPGDVVDAVVKISQAGQGWLKGEWYSTIFGRVGTFLVRKGAPPDRIPRAPIMGELRNEYLSSKFVLDLDVALGRASANTENPFFPLSLAGYFSYRSNIASRIMITGGSYDFFTGKIGFEIAGGSRAVTGIVGNRDLKLRWMSRGFATVIQDSSMKRFRRRSGG